MADAVESMMNEQKNSVRSIQGPELILRFWFKDIDPKQWWIKDPHFDDTIKDTFLQLLTRAKLGELWQWRTTISGRLAEIILLDQFSRNIYRDTPQAFATDGQALSLAQEAVATNTLAELPSQHAAFLLMPYMHSESLTIHQQAVTLFKQFAPDNVDFEYRHQAIIEQFGRYPHRNAILGRQSTAEEMAFLQQPGSSF